MIAMIATIVAIVVNRDFKTSKAIVMYKTVHETTPQYLTFNFVFREEVTDYLKRSFFFNIEEPVIRSTPTAIIFT